MDILFKLDHLFKDSCKDLKPIQEFLELNSFIFFTDELQFNFNSLQQLPYVDVSLNDLFNVDSSENYFQLIDLSSFNCIFNSEKKIRTTRYV